jgi:rhamnosyltransferase
MKPSCSIVIRAFNEEEHIGRLLEGILQQTVKDVEVIVVDSGSTDHTTTIARRFNATLIQIPPADFTFGHSLNKGIESAHAEIVLIASAHVYPVYPDWIEQMMQIFKDPKIALVYGKQRGTPESHFSEQQIFLHWYPEESHIPQENPFCNNANVAIRRSLWKENPYDVTLPGLEDLAWAKWALDRKYKIGYVSEAEIIHVHNESWHGIHNRYKREGMAFKQIYPNEKFGIRDLLLLFAQNSVSDLVQAAKKHQLLQQAYNIFKFRWNQFHGTYLGYHQSGPLTWQLKQSFYYPRNQIEHRTCQGKRPVEPIAYDKISDNE